MNKRLFVVTQLLKATFCETGKPRDFSPNQELFAEYPLSPVDGYVIFEQDGIQFRTAEVDFVAGTRLKNT